MAYRHLGPLGPPPVGPVMRRLTHLAQRTPVALAHTILRARTPTALDALAGTATGGRWGVAGLRAHIAAGDRVPDAWLTPGRRPALIACAVVLIAGRFESGDLHLGLRLLDAADGAKGGGRLHAAVRLLHVQAAMEAGEDTHAATLLRRHELDPVVHQRVETDLLHPYRGTKVVTPQVHARWEEALSAPFVDAGLTPLTVDPDAPHLFDGLRGVPAPATHGPLVTVVMPCFRPDEGLVTSVESMLGQSHADLEVLVVDDCSGDAWEHLFDEVAALDPRVRVLRPERNGGSYLARNLALTQARGAYVTTQDADDWSHPQRIAEQVRILQEQPLAAGCRSSAYRALDDLTHGWIGYSPKRYNASSLMVRRSAMERVGPFDPVRRSADSEYLERLLAGAGPVVDSPVPMAITRLRAGTLSRGDFSYQWAAQDRGTYRAMYRHWHRRLASAPEQLPLDPDPSHPHFPVPPAYRRGLPGARALADRYDVLHVADLTRTNALTASTGPRLTLDGGRGALAVMHLVDPTEPSQTRGEESGRVLDAVAAGHVDWVGDADRVRARTVLISSPGVVEVPTVVTPDVEADEVVVLLDPPSGRPFLDLAEAIRGARSLFGRTPRWAALSPEVAAEWARTGLEIQTWSGALEVDGTGSEAGSHAPAAAVVPAG